MELLLCIHVRGDDERSVRGLLVFSPVEAGLRAHQHRPLSSGASPLPSVPVLGFFSCLSMLSPSL